MLKAIVFDFDGVILDTELDRFAELKRELKFYGYTLHKRHLLSLLGKKTKEFLKENFPQLSDEIMRQIADKRRQSITQNAIRLNLMPGIEDLAKYLALHYQLAITTGSLREIAKKVLEHYHLSKYFRLIVAGEDFKTSKPDPECYLLTLKKLDLRPSEAIIIEDSEAGITAAKKAGCRVFALQNRYNKGQIIDADKIFKSHNEILNYFKSI